MRKLTMVLALVVVMVPLIGAAAFAADQLIQCQSIPCYGSSNDDKILERIGNGKADKILPGGGHDLIKANNYTNDKANGGRGGHDWCIVDVRSEAGRGCEKVTR